MIKKSVCTILALCWITIGLIAQEAKEKKVIVIKKMNENGVITETRTEAQGAEADILIKEMGENEGVDIEELIKDGKKTITINKKLDGAEEIVDVKKVEKNIEVTAEMVDGKPKEKYKIITITDGNENVIEWNGEGEMPEAIAKEIGDVNIIKSSDGKNMEVIVDADSPSGQPKGRKMMIIEKKLNGEDGPVDWTPKDEEERKFMRGDMKFRPEMHKNNNKVSLGVMIADTDQGVIIEDIVDGSAAATAGLRRGDVLLKINDKYIFTSNGLTEILKPFNPNEKVKVKYIRDGKEKSTSATLKARG